MTKKIVVDENECIGCRACAIIADDVFEIRETEEGPKSFVVDGKENAGEDSRVQDAIKSCPTAAILEEEN